MLTQVCFPLDVRLNDFDFITQRTNHSQALFSIISETVTQSASGDSMWNWPPSAYFLIFYMNFESSELSGHITVPGVTQHKLNASSCHKQMPVTVTTCICYYKSSLYWAASNRTWKSSEIVKRSSRR